MSILCNIIELWRLLMLYQLYKRKNVLWKLMICVVHRQKTDKVIIFIKTKAEWFASTYNRLFVVLTSFQTECISFHRRETSRSKNIILWLGAHFFWSQIEAWKCGVNMNSLYYHIIVAFIIIHDAVCTDGKINMDIILSRSQAHQ